jgi:2-(1,2-epoxy-1,2-dihydrophenyl)acetyl-CoA isomerase
METLLIERAAGVVTVTLNRPERKNAINEPMWTELLETFREIGSNVDEDRAVVITGAGSAFCSGADIGGGVNEQESHGLTRMRLVGDVCLALHAIPQPVIAKVSGVAAGAGLNLALGCDLIVATDDARFSEIFARRGLTVDFGGSWVLPRLIGLHKAKELVLFADILGAKEAQEIGIVNRVVPAAQIDAFVDDWATRLAAGPPLALSMSKRLLNDSMEMSLAHAVDAEGVAQNLNFASKDTTEAMMAFVQKREPRFHGR